MPDKDAPRDYGRGTRVRTSRLDEFARFAASRADRREAAAGEDYYPTGRVVLATVTPRRAEAFRRHLAETGAEGLAPAVGQWFVFTLHNSAVGREPGVHSYGPDEAAARADFAEARALVEWYEEDDPYDPEDGV